MAEIAGGVSLGQVLALMAPIAAQVDTLVTDGLTSANRQQALRIQVTPDANGRG